MLASNGNIFRSLGISLNKKKNVITGVQQSQATSVFQWRLILLCPHYRDSFMSPSVVFTVFRSSLDFLKLLCAPKLSKHLTVTKILRFRFSLYKVSIFIINSHVTSQASKTLLETFLKFLHWAAFTPRAVATYRRPLSKPQLPKRSSF